MTEAEERRESYETPELHSLPGSVLARPPGLERRIAPMPRVAGWDVKDLAARFGSPLCVIDERVLRAAYQRLDAAFRAGWKDTVIAASIKTNYLSAVVAILRSMGAWGEVVSGFEYRLCRDLGIPGGQIVFNGPWKSDQELELAFHEGALVNLDSDDELERVIKMARARQGELRVGLRVGVELNDAPWDKFGFAVENDHALEAARVIAREKNLILDGLHVHVGTYIPDAGVYGRACEALIGLGLRLERELGVEIRHIDLGGGYASRNTLRHTLLPGEAIAASAEEYARAITVPLKRAAAQFRRPPRLFIEPGRILVDEAAAMIATVRAVKRVSGQQKAALVDCGVHLLPTAFWYEHEIRPVEDRGQAVENYRVVGPLCMQIDVLRESALLPALRAGDLLVIRDAGAYNFSQSMQFIHMRPNYVLVHDGGVDVIREREADACVRAPERLPPHLINAETRGSILAGGG
ncbi:MAG: diaminopimelate decarboxylase [Planctomycetes bacterium]|nr:diaminopimelate decarboxylase [Planctomycetota bacterium]